MMQTDRFNDENNNEIDSSFETLEDVIWDWCDKQRDVLEAINLMDRIMTIICQQPFNRTKNMVDEMENTWK